MKLKLKDPKYSVLLIGLILAAVATLLFIVIPASPNLTVSYVFCLLGIALMLGSYLFADSRNVAASYALIWQAGRFLPISLVLSVAVLVLERIGIYTLPTIWHVVLQILPLAFVAIRLVQVIGGAAYVDQVEEKVDTKRNEWVAWTNQLNVLAAAEGDAQAKRAIQKAVEAMRYADPLGTEASRAVEDRIAETIERIQVKDSAARSGLCEELCGLVRERNAMLKAGK